MKNKKITRKISQGVYVLTTVGGGCIVDAVSQISASDNPLIAVAVMKKNYTNELLHKNEKFALSVLDANADGRVIETFGLNSMRDIDKFANTDLETIDGLNIIPSSIGYIVCEIVERIENDTHTLIIGRMIEGDVIRDASPMTYAYYQENKETILSIKTAEGKVAWICLTCGYIYYGDTLPEDFKCPICGVDASHFKKKL